MPYGIQPIISRTAFVEAAVNSLRLSPYNIVSIDGKNLTVIGGLIVPGNVEEVKYKPNHVKIGNALKKNWDVIGTRNRIINTR